MIALRTMDADLPVTGDAEPIALRQWTARPGLEAKLSRDGDRLIADSSGSPGCFGGWDIVLPAEGGQHYSIGLNYAARDMVSVKDGVAMFVFWTDDDDKFVSYDYMILHEPDAVEGRAERVLRCPDKATRAVLRFGVRWTATGHAEFWGASMEAVAAPPCRVHRIAVAAECPSNPQSQDDLLHHFCDLARAAADRQPDLVLMPEVILSWRVPGTLEELARPIPGPETDAFAAIAAEHRMMIAFSMNEACGDLVYNALVILGPDGSIIGAYRKTHLAPSEGWDGVTPGDVLPVFETPVGRVACTICMDSSVAEASRQPAMHGAEVMLLPIMGDHRAVQWLRPSDFSPDRWKVIMRARAIENQMWMVVARNTVEGSCIISPSGDILAWNDGRQRVITADCEISEACRPAHGTSFRDATWADRRPHLYSPM